MPVINVENRSKAQQVGHNAARTEHSPSRQQGDERRRASRSGPPGIDDLQSSASTAPTAGRVAPHATLSEPAPNALLLGVEAVFSGLTRRDGASRTGGGQTPK